MRPDSEAFCSCAFGKHTQIWDCNVGLLLKAYVDTHCHLGLLFVRVFDNTPSFMFMLLMQLSWNNDKIDD